MLGESLKPEDVTAPVCGNEAQSIGLVLRKRPQAHITGILKLKCMQDVRFMSLDCPAKQGSSKEVVCELIKYPEWQAKPFAQGNNFVIGSRVAFQ